MHHTVCRRIYMGTKTGYAPGLLNRFHALPESSVIPSLSKTISPKGHGNMTIWRNDCRLSGKQASGYSFRRFAVPRNRIDRICKVDFPALRVDRLFALARDWPWPPCGRRATYPKSHTRLTGKAVARCVLGIKEDL
jgi:hypothetical protein